MERRDFIKLCGGSLIVGSSGCIDNEPTNSSEPEIGVPVKSFSLRSIGYSAWQLRDTGDVSVGSENLENPNLTLREGVRYEITNLGAETHQLAFRDTSDTVLLSQRDSGEFEDDIRVNWVEDGNVVRFTVTEELDSRMAEYFCVYHSRMKGFVD